MCTTTAETTVASGSGSGSVSGCGDASSDLIGEGASSPGPDWRRPLWHQGQRLNLRIFKLLISCCVLMLSIYTNAWHLAISPGSGSGWVMAGSIKGRGDAHRLDEMGSIANTHSSSSSTSSGLSSTWLTQSNSHANISNLLDNLLRGYDNSIRPDFGGEYRLKG